MAKNAALNHEAPFGKRLGRDLRKNYPLYLLALPAVVVIFLLNYMPMYGVVMAFQDFRPISGFLGSRWVGLKNFQRFFNSYQFWDLFSNTVGLSLLNLLFTFPVPIVLAIMINQVHRTRLKKTIQTAVYLPHFIATVVLVSMMQVLFNTRTGVYGVIAQAFGVQDPVNLFALKSSFRPMFIGASIWQNAGWDSIIYIAALTSIDPSLYEAATVDGANKAQRVLHIDVPSILPTMVTLLILRSGSIMNVNFDRAYLLQNDLNINISEIISTYEYKIGLRQGQFSYSAAIGLFNNIVNLILLLIVNKVSKTVSGTGLW